MNIINQFNHQSFLSEMVKLSSEKSTKASAMYAPVRAAGKGGKWGAILGGGLSGALAHGALGLGKITPGHKAYLPVLVASMLAGSLYGGTKGAYVGAAMGGAEKVTSHLH